MNLFGLKGVADKLLSNFPWNEPEYGHLSLTIGSDRIEVSGNSKAINWAMKTSCITEMDRRVLVINIPDDDVYENSIPPSAS
jgi:hypothetical protein